jgi:hypothetical protein
MYPEAGRNKRCIEVILLIKPHGLDTLLRETLPSISF